MHSQELKKQEEADTFPGEEKPKSFNHVKENNPFCLVHPYALKGNSLVDNHYLFKRQGNQIRV